MALLCVAQSNLYAGLPAGIEVSISQANGESSERGQV